MHSGQGALALRSYRYHAKSQELFEKRGKKRKGENKEGRNHQEIH